MDQTELERHDQDCFFSLQERTGYTGRYCQSPAPGNLFKNIPVHEDTWSVAKQQIYTFLIHPCLRKDQGDASFAIKEPQRSISFLGCPRYLLTTPRATSISMKSDTCFCLFLLVKQNLAEKKRKKGRVVTSGDKGGFLLFRMSPYLSHRLFFSHVNHKRTWLELFCT